MRRRASSEVTCTVAEMQEGDEWHGQVVTEVAPLDYRPGWSLVHWRDASDRLPSDLTVTVLRDEPTVEVPASIIEDVRMMAAALNNWHGLRAAEAAERVRNFLAHLEVER